MNPSPAESYSSAVRRALFLRAQQASNGISNNKHDRKAQLRHQLLSTTPNPSTPLRRRIAQALRHALINEQMYLCFQPRLNMEGQVIALEALIRWHHPQLGLMPPSTFIPIAEHTGAIVALGEWVIHTACVQSRAWQDAGFHAVPIAVNVSARQFHQADFVDRVTQNLALSGLAPHYLELEVTESVVMHDMDAVAATLAQLKALGVKLAIDDFGTGFSSLSYLHLLPVDYLKIDRSFVRHLCTDPACTTIIDSIIALGHNLHLRVIAEGIETDAQLQHLLERHCDELQGYLLSYPVSADEATRFLARVRRH